MVTFLTSDDCSNIEEANDLFATESGLIVLKPTPTCCNTYSFTIPTGCYALVTSHGADLDYVDENGESSAIWPPGLHFPYPPWVRVSHLVTKQSIIMDLMSAACKTCDNVYVNVITSIAFRVMGEKHLGENPELVRKFVHELKPRGLQSQLQDSLESEIRALVKKFSFKEIYGIRDMLDSTSDEFDIDDSKDEEDYLVSSKHSEVDAFFPTASHDIKKRMKRLFLYHGIQIESVFIKEVSLHESIHNQLSEKAMFISAIEEEKLYFQDEMLKMRMGEEIEALNSNVDQQKIAEIQVGLEIINKEQMKLNDAIEQARKSEAYIRETCRVDTENQQTKLAFEVEKMKSATLAKTSEIEFKAKNLCSQLLAEATFESNCIIADAESKAASTMATVDIIIAEAEGKTSKWTGNLKRFETALRQLDVYESLASNSNLIVGSSEDEKTNLSVVADAILEENYGNEFLHGVNDISALAAEMALLGVGY